MYNIDLLQSKICKFHALVAKAWKTNLTRGMKKKEFGGSGVATNQSFDDGYTFDASLPLNGLVLAGDEAQLVENEDKDEQIEDTAGQEDSASAETVKGKYHWPANTSVAYIKSVIKLWPESDSLSVHCDVVKGAWGLRCYVLGK